MAHKILYIEDNEANRQLVELIIAQRPDFELITAASGTEGLERAKTEQPDIILLDLSLPDMHGIEVLQLLKIDDSLKAIPVISLSGSQLSGEISHTQAQGFFTSLSKPVEITALYKALDDAISHIA